MSNSISLAKRTTNKQIFKLLGNTGHIQGYGEPDTVRYWRSRLLALPWRTPPGDSETRTCAMIACKCERDASCVELCDWSACCLHVPAERWLTSWLRRCRCHCRRRRRHHRYFTESQRSCLTLLSSSQLGIDCATSQTHSPQRRALLTLTKRARERERESVELNLTKFLLRFAYANCVTIYCQVIAIDIDNDTICSTFEFANSPSSSSSLWIMTVTAFAAAMHRPFFNGYTAMQGKHRHRLQMQCIKVKKSIFLWKLS